MQSSIFAVLLQNEPTLRGIVAKRAWRSLRPVKILISLARKPWPLLCELVFDFGKRRESRIREHPADLATDVGQLQQRVGTVKKVGALGTGRALREEC